MWRWPVDDEKPQDNEKPSAKVIPLVPKPPAQVPSGALESESVNILQLMKGIITDVVNHSDPIRARLEDQEVLDDKCAFHQRFGFTVKLSRRQKVLDFKHEADVTDREIRLLWQTVNLTAVGRAIPLIWVEVTASLLLAPKVRLYIDMQPGRV